MWPLQKTDTSWRMTVIHHECNQVVTPSAAAGPDVVSLLSKITPPPGSWCAALHPAGAFPLHLLVKTTGSNLLSAGQATNMLCCPTSGYINSPALCHDLVHGNLNCLFLPQNITLISYNGDITLIGPSEQGVAASLDLLVRHLCVRGWEIYLKKFRVLHQCDF